jgi:hypothetical protein
MQLSIVLKVKITVKCNQILPQNLPKLTQDRNTDFQGPQVRLRHRQPQALHGVGLEVLRPRGHRERRHGRQRSGRTSQRLSTNLPGIAG